MRQHIRQLVRASMLNPAGIWFGSHRMEAVWRGNGVTLSCRCDDAEHPYLLRCLYGFLNTNGLGARRMGYHNDGGQEVHLGLVVRGEAPNSSDVRVVGDRFHHGSQAYQARRSRRIHRCSFQRSIPNNRNLFEPSPKIDLQEAQTVYSWVQRLAR